MKLSRSLSLLIGVLAFFLVAAFSCTPTPIPVQITEGGLECQPVTPPDGAETILIPSSTYKMGSPAGTPGAAEDEMPQHDVELTCFNIYKEEVTNAMYKACVDAGICFGIQPVEDTLSALAEDPAYADKPAVGVDYNMATQYCEWIGGRLPTEAEWEYAALQNTGKTFPWGDDPADCDHANFAGCSDPNDTFEVGTLAKGESPFKVQDLAGNAWEWVFDWYAEEYYASSPTSNPVGPSEGETKVARGGSFNSIADMLDSTNRHAGNPYNAYANVGFRCVIGSGLTLPADYNPPDRKLHYIPPGNSIDGGDPNDPNHPVSYLSTLPLNCPDANANLHVSIKFGIASDPTVDSFSLNGIAYTCDPLDTVNHLLTCSGPVPAPDALPSYKGKLCWTPQGKPQVCSINMPFPKPQNCDQNQGTDSMKLMVECPINGQIIANFAYNPAVFWTKVMISGDMDLMNCLPTSPNAMTCVGPDKQTTGQYMFHLEGVYNNTNILDLEYADPPQNCPDQSDHPFSKSIFSCANGSPVLDVFYSPPTTSDIAFKVNGSFLQCIKIADGHAQCPVDPFLSGSTVPVEICVDGSCLQMNSDIPNCQDVPQYGYKIDSFCDAKGAGIKIHFDPAPPQAISKVVANTIELTCGQNSPTDWTCGGLPGQPGDMLYIVIEYIDGDLDGGSLTVPACASSAEYNYWSILYCEEDNQYTFDSDVLPAVPNEPENPIISTKMDGQLLTCDCFLPFDCFCRNLDLTPGDTHTFEVCYTYGPCHTFQHTVQKCKQDDDCSCRILEVACKSETSIEFRVQTCAENPKPLQDGSVSAYENNTHYGCALIPGFEGRVYCSGPYPNPLSEFLFLEYQYVGNSYVNICQINGWKSMIPGCQTPDKPDEPVQPNCSQWPGPDICAANGCKWVYSTVGPGYCTNNP